MADGSMTGSMVFLSASNNIFTISLDTEALLHKASKELTGVLSLFSILMWSVHHGDEWQILTVCTFSDAVLSKLTCII